MYEHEKKNTRKTNYIDYARNEKNDVIMNSADRSLSSQSDIRKRKAQKRVGGSIFARENSKPEIKTSHEARNVTFNVLESKIGDIPDNATDISGSKSAGKKKNNYAFRDAPAPSNNKLQYASDTVKKASSLAFFSQTGNNTDDNYGLEAAERTENAATGAMRFVDSGYKSYKHSPERAALRMEKAAIKAGVKF